MTAQVQIMEPGRNEQKDSPEQPDQPGKKIGDPLQKTVLPPEGKKTPLVQPVRSSLNEPVPQGAENLVEVSDLTWEKLVEKEKVPVAVMFYSPTCVFCHQMEPYFRSYAKEYHGTVVFARLNIMTSQWTAERYGVRSTPTFRFFCDGKPVQEMVGAVYPALLKRAVDEVLIHGKECAKNSTSIDYEITGYG
jgi:thioredoxin 1